MKRVILAGLLTFCGWALQAQVLSSDWMKYDWSVKGPAPSIEAQIRSATPEQLRAHEGVLIYMLEPGLGTPAKAWACRMLRIVGTENAVPALAKLLDNKDLAADALFALRSISGAKVNEALRTAAAKTDGLQRAGVIQILGARKDREAVGVIAPFLNDTNTAVAEAAIWALGKIGGKQALKVLQDATLPNIMIGYRNFAVLCCAESILAEGQPSEAYAVYESLFKTPGDPDITIKAAALRGMGLTDPARAAPLVTAALKDPRRPLRLASARLVSDSGSAELHSKVFADFSNYPPETQVLLLEGAQCAEALPSARSSSKSLDESVRQSALDCLGRLGQAQDADLLLGIAAMGKGNEHVAARKALQMLPSVETDARLINLAQTGEIPVRGEAIRVLALRNAKAAVPMLLEQAKHNEQMIRREALTGLGALAGAQAIPELVNLLVAATADDRETAEATILSVSQRIADKEAAAESLLKAFAGQGAEVRCALLRVLGKINAPKSLAMLRQSTKDAEPGIRETAVRGLANWPEAEVLPDLAALAKTSEDPTQKVLALRGYIRLAALPSKRSAAETTTLLSNALALAPSANEKKLALSVLSEVNHPDALTLGIKCLKDSEVEVEAAAAVVQIAKALRKENRARASAALQTVLETCKSPAARQLAESATTIVDAMMNIAQKGTASSPDGWDKDGQAGGDRAGIDDNPITYWDEVDGKELYRYLVTFKQPEKIAAVSIIGYQHQNFAPKDFEILCDDKPVKKVTGAKYDNNFLAIPLPEMTCQSVELKITAYYGASPAIREFGIYAPGGKLPEGEKSAK